jgi:hypothetical protein
MVLDGKSAAIALVVMPLATASLSSRRSSGVHLGVECPRLRLEVFAFATLIGCNEFATSEDPNFDGGGELSSALLHRADVDMPLSTTKDT